MRGTTMRLLAGVGAVVGLLLAGCGVSAGAAGQGQATQPPTAIKTASVTVAGKATTILTDEQGRTLYYFTGDTARAVLCTGTCAATWPPLLAPASGEVHSATPLPGVLASLDGANGKQVVYNGHPLYVFSGDGAAGDIKGQGFDGKWFVATPELTQNAGGTDGY